MTALYKQAYRDHSYLWSCHGPAWDMTGSYVDQNDLKALLENPTKTKAAECLVSQINYWFEVGPEDGAGPEWLSDPRVKEIAERYGCKEDYRHWVTDIN